MASGSGNVSNVVQFGGGAITSTTANGVPPQITVPLTSLSSMITLLAGCGSVGANGNYLGFYSASSPGSTAAYQVPSGKTLYVLGFYYTAGGANYPAQLGYGTAAVVSEPTSTPPTGAIYYGSSSSSANNTGFQTTAAIPAYTYFPVGLSFPANSYPFIRMWGTSSGGNAIMIGILQ